MNWYCQIRKYANYQQLESALVKALMNTYSSAVEVSEEIYNILPLTKTISQYEVSGAIESAKNKVFKQLSQSDFTYQQKFFISELWKNISGSQPATNGAKNESTQEAPNGPTPDVQPAPVATGQPGDVLQTNPIGK